MTPTENIPQDFPPFSANVGKRSPSTVFVHGEVDLVTAPEMAKRIHAVLETRPEKLSLDLADVNFLDGAGVGVIADVLRDAPDGFIVVIRRPQPLPRRVLELTGIADLCDMEV